MSLYEHEVHLYVSKLNNAQNQSLVFYFNFM